MSSWDKNDEPYGQNLDQADYHADVGHSTSPWSARNRRCESESVAKAMSGSGGIEDDHHESQANFRVRLDVRQFRPHEVTVQHDGEIVAVHGHHEERSPGNGFISRDFTRKYEIPKDVDPDKVTCSWHANNVLVINAPRDSVLRPALGDSPNNTFGMTKFESNQVHTDI